jgi:sporulation protein YlmC with PRC-barrel domain
MEIPINAQVECTDGGYGHSVYVLINPVVNQVTNLVVKEDSSPNTVYIVPVNLVKETISDKIRLVCSKAEMQKMDPFIKKAFIGEEVPDKSYGHNAGMGPFFRFPYVTADRTVYEPVENQHNPPQELTVHRGTRVEAMDGYVGKLDEFVINPDNGQITHLVMREGHLWGQKEVTIPVSLIDHYQDKTVYLKLNKKSIEALAGIPIHHDLAKGE